MRVCAREVLIQLRNIGIQRPHEIKGKNIRGGKLTLSERLLLMLSKISTLGHKKLQHPTRQLQQPIGGFNVHTGRHVFLHEFESAPRPSNLRHRQRAVSLQRLVFEPHLHVCVGYLHGSRIISCVLVLHARALRDESWIAGAVASLKLYVSSARSSIGNRQHDPHRLLRGGQMILHAPRLGGGARARDVDDQSIGHNGSAPHERKLPVGQPLLIDYDLRQAPCIRCGCPEPCIQYVLAVSIPLLKVMGIEGHSLKPNNSPAVLRHDY